MSDISHLTSRGWGGGGGGEGVGQYAPHIIALYLPQGERQGGRLRFQIDFFSLTTWLHFHDVFSTKKYLLFKLRTLFHPFLP
jgi:hypothetical protein